MLKKIFSKQNMIYAAVFAGGVVTSGLVRRKVPYASKLPAVN